jgi:hypothetical protein
MKAHVLFDDGGGIIAVMHLPEEQMKGRHSGGFVAEAGEHVATLEIPAELEVLNARELHVVSRIDLSGGQPRLISASSGKV